MNGIKYASLVGILASACATAPAHVETTREITFQDGQIGVIDLRAQQATPYEMQLPGGYLTTPLAFEKIGAIGALMLGTVTDADIAVNSDGKRGCSTEGAFYSAFFNPELTERILRVADTNRDMHVTLAEADQAFQRLCLRMTSKR